MALAQPQDVILNIYEIAGLTLVGGAYHTGVQVHGVEFCYGRGDPGVTVLETPRSFAHHTFRAAILLGYTNLSYEEVCHLSTTYTDTAGPYHLFHNNCNNFSEFFTDILLQHGGSRRRFPKWVNRLARLCCVVIPRFLRENIEQADAEVFHDLRSLTQTTSDL